MAKNKGKKTVMLAPAIGDWTTYKPAVLEKPLPSLVRGSEKLSDEELSKSIMAFIPCLETYLHSVSSATENVFTLNSVSLDQLTYPQVLKEINTPVVQFKIKGETGFVYVCTDVGIANEIINFSLGGHSAGMQAFKELTEIEKTVLETTLTVDISKTFPYKNQYEALQFINIPNLYFDRTVNVSSPFLLLCFEVGFSQNKKGLIYIVIETRILKRNLLAEHTSGNLDMVKLGKINSSKIFFDLTSYLGSASISAKDLYELQEGDVILLDRSINNLLPINIEKHLNLSGQIGIKEGKIALQIRTGGSAKVEVVRSLSPQTVLEKPVTDYSGRNFESVVSDMRPEEIVVDEMTLNKDVIEELDLAENTEDSTELQDMNFEDFFHVGA